MTNSSPRSRRLLQFSLRTLLLAMLLVAVFLGGRESMRHVIESERQRADAERKQAESARLQAEAALYAQARAELQAQNAVQQSKMERAIREMDELPSKANQDLPKQLQNSRK